MSGLPEEGADALDLDPPPARPPARLGRFLLACGLALALLAALALGTTRALLAERERSLHAALEARLEALAHGRALALGTWLDGSARQGDRLARSELVRLFAREMALAESGAPLAEALAQQAPYMRRLLRELGAAEGLAGAWLLGPDGRPLLAPDDAPPLARAALDAALARLEGGAPRAVLPPRLGPSGPLVDILLPIAAPQTEPDEAPLAGALLLAAPAAPPLARLLAPSPLDAPGERLRLLLPAAEGPRVVTATAAGLHDDALDPARDPAPGLPVAYGPRTASDGLEVLARGVVVPELGWTVLQEVSRDAALAPLAEFRRSALGAALLLGLALLAAFAAFWWRQSAGQLRALAEQYRRLAGRIERHRRLLDRITGAVPELIGLKDQAGRYRWVNPAFARAFARGPDALVGRSGADLLPAEEAALQADAAARVLASGEAEIGPELPLTLATGTRWVQASTVPLTDESGAVAGVVTVARDLTATILQRRRLERAVRAAVTALCRTVELADPYLQGHSRRVAELAVAIGRRLGLAADDLATLELAGSLSQIGKTFIPPAILRKPERHTAEEQAVMRRHVDHALALLDDIDFGLPVAATIAQMHERLDGSGYPRGLAGDAIGPLGRVLAVADVFCARTEPRAYRDRISPARAVGLLADHPARYDAKVVATLASLVLAAAAPAGDEAARRSA